LIRYCGLVDWWNATFTPDEQSHIVYRLLSKASALAGQGCSSLDLRVLDRQLIQTCYRDGDQQAYLEAAISACEHQIAIAPQTAAACRAEWGADALPTHRGYEQLAVTREKRGDYDAVVALCQPAASQGWAGDWQKRIGRARKRRAKA
jgi:hypothetical protein